jgi:hypothetical protein
VKQATQDVVAPDLERIKGELAVLRAEVGAVRTELRAESGGSALGAESRE